MKIISNKNILIKFINNEKNIGFVPTMGAIHLGHISLIKKCLAQCDITIVSIFINKPQFNRMSDFQKYPRIIKRDIKKLKKMKIDYLFIPSVKQIYPNGPDRNIKISSFKNKLCGKFRPGHFEAIVDVIDRFIKIIKPEKIYLGEKDMQQLKIIDHFVRKKHNKTKIISCKTKREYNGIPYSSRNLLLSSKEKNIASKVYKFLIKRKHDLIKKKISLKSIKKKLSVLGISKIDYIEIFDINKVVKPYKKRRTYKIFLAYYLGSTRLIDNI